MAPSLSVVLFTKVLCTCPIFLVGLYHPLYAQRIGGFVIETFDYSHCRMYIAIALYRNALQILHAFTLPGPLNIHRHVWNFACFDLLLDVYTMYIYLYHHPHHFVSWFAIYHGGIIVASVCSITTVHQSANGKHISPV